MSASLPDDVKMELAAGNKIAAIRLLRQHTGLGLKQAEAAVESAQLPHTMVTADSFGPSSTVWPAAHAQGLPASAAAALAAGQKVKAVLLVCAEREVGLKEARAMVDAASRGLAPGHESRRASGMAPGEVPPSRFSSLTMVAVLMLLILVWLRLSAD